MNRVLRALAALGAALVFAGCGSTDSAKKEDGYWVDGVHRDCDPISDAEAPYVGGPGWKPACSGLDRMADVPIGFEPDSDNEIWGDGNDQNGQGDDLGGNSDIGQTHQAITFAANQGLSAEVNASGNILSHRGACRFAVHGNPITDTCLLPSKVNFLWEVCPSSICRQMLPSDVAYFRDRFKAAWTVWRNGITRCDTGASDPIVTADSARSFFQPGVVTDADAYNKASLPIWFSDINNPEGFIGRTSIFNPVTQFSQVISGVIYYSYKYAGIEIDFDRMEGPLGKAHSCNVTPEILGPTAYANAISRAYERILAHELGHVRGIAHQSRGLMRPGNLHSCTEIFQTPQPSTLPIGDTVAKALLVIGDDAIAHGVQRMRDSSGANRATLDATCFPGLQFGTDSANTTDFGIQ